MQREIYEFGSAFETPDFKEGTVAFLEKRKPLFNYSNMFIYSRYKIIPVLNNFIQKYNTKGNMKLLAESFQRELILKDFKSWIQSNINAFISPVIQNNINLSNDNNKILPKNNIPLTNEKQTHIGMNMIENISQKAEINLTDDLQNSSETNVIEKTQHDLEVNVIDEVINDSEARADAKTNLIDEVVNDSETNLIEETYQDLIVIFNDNAQNDSETNVIEEIYHESEINSINNQEHQTEMQQNSNDENIKIIIEEINEV
jgi:hypothetical protein